MALEKAAYYAKMSGCLTLAEDSGLFIDSLHGWPGAKSARIGDASAARIELVLRALDGRIGDERRASFRSAVAVSDPVEQTSCVSTGVSPGYILEKRANDKYGFDYDPIFFSTEAGKSFAELTIPEKNAVSQRGKALIKAK